MNIGVPRETRPFEFRVGLPPAGVRLFSEHGHSVFVESCAGIGAGFEDPDYQSAGAQIVYSREEAFGRADLILKFSRPTKPELDLLPAEKVLAGFLHLTAARQEKLEIIRAKQLTTLAYEQIEDETGYRPVLAPLSQIGGRMAVEIAARLLQNDHGGRGILLGGVAGVPAAEVVILGAGNVGKTAAAAFSQAGAQVTVLDIDLSRLQKLHDNLPFPVVTLLSTPSNIRRSCLYADVILGAVMVPGDKTPILVNRETVSKMKSRSVILDLSIDQGGCFETSRPTNHGSPTYIEEGVIHYCVPNMSGVLGRTATHALFTGAYPFFEELARHGIEETLISNPALERGLNTFKGEVRNFRSFGSLGTELV
jgi:alanine dehydrogenase